MKKFVLEVTLRNEKSCDDCPGYNFDSNHGTWFCSATEEGAVLKSRQQPDWCPLKEVEGDEE